MICTSLQHRTYEEIIAVLQNPKVEMAEIRLDLCNLSEEEIRDLFENCDTPLIATSRGDAGKLAIAIEAGARFADLELEASVQDSRRIQKLCRENGTELIRSYHNYDETPSDEVLQMALARCFRYGADIAKIVTTCNTDEDVARLEALYGIVLEGVDSLQGRLVAFGMGEKGRESRISCLRRGAPFSYAALNEEEATAPGQYSLELMWRLVYGSHEPLSLKGLRMPASKSFAQRAIIAAALAKGTSVLHGYSSCGDNESAIRVAEQFGAFVVRRGSDLIITGADRFPVKDRLHTGESGLLTRLSIPLLAALGEGSVGISGEKTLTRRPLTDAAGIMASFGVLLQNEDEKRGPELFVPLKVKGKLIPGNADVSGKGGSQLISGLLMALPLCQKDSRLFVSEPKSIPYMYITLDVLRHFGIKTRSEMEGDAEMLENNDWSACSGIDFAIRGNQKYRPADFNLEGDWSAAANFLVAGAIFGRCEIAGLDVKSLQADITIMDILVDAGAVVSQLEDGTVGVCKAPLEAITADLNNAPDIFPIVSVLAAFCSGESRIAGIGRLAGKESDRAAAVLDMLVQMGVEARIEGDELVVCGETADSRILSGRMLKGGEYTSHHDHRMAMALTVAAMGAESPVTIDDEACVGKSFPDFFTLIR